MIVAIIQVIIDAIAGLVNLADVLFTSPFSRVDRTISDSQVLGMLNWLIPVAEFVAILQAWCAAVAAWYVVSMVLRWMKAIS